MLVRRLLHAKGYRYRLHGTARGGKLPGNPDLVFAGRHKVIFVNGCFWHFHDCRVGQHAPQGKRRVLGNQAHADAEPRRRPAASARTRGWEVLTVWECELKDRSALELRLDAFLQGLSHPGAPARDEPS